MARCLSVHVTVMTGCLWDDPSDRMLNDMTNWSGFYTFMSHWVHDKTNVVDIGQHRGNRCYAKLSAASTGRTQLTAWSHDCKGKAI